MKKTIIIYPLLLGIYPILFLFSTNVALFPLNDLWVSLIIVVGAISLTWILTYLILKSSHKSALLVALSWTTVLSYNQIFGPLQGLKVLGFVLGSNRILVSFWAVILLISGYFIIKSQRNFANLTRMVNIVSIVLVLFSVFNIVIYECKNRDKYQDSIVSEMYIPEGQPRIMGKLPDIYYLIFDRYASSTTLKESYGYDNIEFINFLKAKGFYVAEQSHANYSTTVLSLASSLNMNYLVLPLSSKKNRNNDQTRYSQRITDNKVLRFLKSQGYSTVHFGSWFWPTGYNPNADVNINYSYLPFRGFALIMFEQSLLYPIFRLFYKLDSGILSAFDKISLLPDEGSPKFVFAHILLPHEPFIFDRDGMLLSSYEKLNTSEKEKYLNQLIFTTKKIETLTEVLLSKSQYPPVIIIQSDEGPYLDMIEDKEPLSNSVIEKRTGILNAYYLPGVKNIYLYSSMTPVNTFRVIINEYFKTNYSLLDDKIYYIKNASSMFDYTDVTKMVFEIN